MIRLIRTPKALAGLVAYVEETADGEALRVRIPYTCEVIEQVLPKHQKVWDDRTVMIEDHPSARVPCIVVEVLPHEVSFEGLGS